MYYTTKQITKATIIDTPNSNNDLKYCALGENGDVYWLTPSPDKDIMVVGSVGEIRLNMFNSQNRNFIFTKN